MLVPALTRLATTRGQTPTEWGDTVLPFALPFSFWSAPAGRSMTERSRAVLLEVEVPPPPDTLRARKQQVSPWKGRPSG